MVSIFEARTLPRTWSFGGLPSIHERERKIRDYSMRALRGGRPGDWPSFFEPDRRALTYRRPDTYPDGSKQRAFVAHERDRTREVEIRLW